MGGKAFALVVLTLFVIWLSGTSLVDRVVDRLAAQPQLGDTLGRADLDARMDALTLLFFCTFAAPFALAVAAAAAAFLLAVLVEAARPASRALAMPETATRATIALAVGSAAWLARDAWLPRSLWVLGVLARAYRVGLT
jgi:hypothetical protein